MAKRLGFPVYKCHLSLEDRSSSRSAPSCIFMHQAAELYCGAGRPNHLKHPSAQPPRWWV